ncbi:MAG TPA: c-type cytochrome biogenesis protein CcmI [Methylococcaceae bacterium]|nr:c-type cytochrome biogenesis protein CcmI [Methylococcaceae bacterium]
MTLFLLLAAVLLLAAALLFIPVLRGKSASRAQRRDALNLLVYRQRRGELERELAEGSLDRATFEKLCEELERDLLEDTAASDASEQPSSAHGRDAVLIVLCLLPLLGIGLYLALGRPDLIDAPPAVSGKTDPGSLQASIAKLTERLQRDPDDVQGWLLLGRSHQELAEYAEALTAYEKAQALKKDDPDIQALRAETLARMQDNSLRGRPTELIEGILIQHPDHPTALWLAGLAATERGDRDEALKHWRLLKAQLPPDGEDARQLDGFLAQLEGKEAPPVQPAGSASVRVRVELAPELAGKIRPEDTLFVFARAAQGSPMPLAIVRRQARDLPVELTLDDSLAMSPENKLSAHSSIRLGARVSRSGQAMPASGDLQGQLGPVETKGNEVYRIVIDKTVE